MSTESLRSRMFRVKSVDQILAETGEGVQLKRSMGLIALTMFSVGSIIGTGIFVILGPAVPLAGPAVVLSFVVAGVACTFSALSYAEMAGTIPISGSSYSYAYATLGEIIAWVCGWCLMMEYGVSVSAVAVGWGEYVNELLGLVGVHLPDSLAQSSEHGGVFNVPAVVVVVLAMLLLLRGASESAKVNTILVFTKILVLLFFCIVAFTAFNAANFTPFMPFGFSGMSLAAGMVFFSFIGFDTASTAGEEAKNPKRDLPRAILLSLTIVTVLYVLVAVAALGARPYTNFSGAKGEAVLAQIMQQVTGAGWPAALLSAAAIISIFSVVLAVIYGQTRILFAMGRDGLLPRVFTKVSPRTQTPIPNTLIVCAVIVVLAAFFPLDTLSEATSIGTLTAFGLVNVGVIVLRRTRPDLPRRFRTPLFPVTPIFGVASCLFLFASLRPITWLIFGCWMTIGLVIYFTYSIKRSRMDPWRISRDESAHRTVSGR